MRSFNSASLLFISLMAVFYLLLPSQALASVTFTAPSTDADGVFNLEWTGVNYYGYIQEKVNGTYTTIATTSSGATGSYGVQRPTGTHEFRLDATYLEIIYYGGSPIYQQKNVVIYRTVTVTGSPLIQGSTTYEYDELGRLKKVVEADSTTSYSYDDAGNRETKTVQQ